MKKEKVPKKMTAVLPPSGDRLPRNLERKYFGKFRLYCSLHGISIREYLDDRSSAFGCDRCKYHDHAMVRGGCSEMLTKFLWVPINGREEIIVGRRSDSWIEHAGGKGLICIEWVRHV